MHLDKTAEGTVTVSSLGQAPTAAEIPVANPPLRAGGYSFKAAVDQWPLLSKPRSCRWQVFAYLPFAQVVTQIGGIEGK